MRWKEGLKGSAMEVAGQGSWSLLTNPSPWCMQFRLADGVWLEGRGAGKACGHVLGQGAFHPCILPSLYSSAGERGQWVLAMFQLWPWCAPGKQHSCTFSSLCSKPWLFWVLVQDMETPSLGQTLLQLSDSRELSPVGPGYASPSSHLSGDLVAPRSPACCTDITHKGFNGRCCNLWLCGALCRDG